MCPLRVRCSRYGTLLAALLAVACFATRPAHAVPMLFTGLVNITGPTSPHATPATPDAIFLAAEGSVLQNLANACQFTETYAGNVTQPPDYSMMDTVKHAAATVPSGTPTMARAITLFSNNTEAQANYIALWNEEFTHPLTLSGTLTPGLGGAPLGSGQLDWQTDSPDNSLLPRPGSIVLALGVVSAFAAFRLHEGLRN